MLRSMPVHPSQSRRPCSSFTCHTLSKRLSCSGTWHQKRLVTGHTRCRLILGRDREGRISGRMRSGSTKATHPQGQRNKLITHKHSWRSALLTIHRVVITNFRPIERPCFRLEALTLDYHIPRLSSLLSKIAAADFSPSVSGELDQQVHVLL